MGKSARVELFPAAPQASKGEPQNVVLPTDRLFTDSPDVGRRDCLCSRCGQRITDFSIRVWPKGGASMPGKYLYHRALGEYRYHPACFGSNPPEGAVIGNDLIINENEEAQAIP